jgi:predicted nucleic acid-binding protein
MILVDANLLVYAHVSFFQQHKSARAWLDSELNGNSPVGLPWHSLLAFLGIVTNPRVFQKPEAIAEAWDKLKSGWTAIWLGFLPPQNGIAKCLVRYWRRREC